MVEESPLAVKMLPLRQGFSFEKENPRIFECDKDDPYFNPKRKYPKMLVPSVPKRKPLTPVPEGPTGEPASLDALSDADKAAYKSQLMDGLRMHIKLLNAIGVDGIKELQNEAGIRALQNCTKDSRNCVICKQHFTTVQRLRWHITKEHCPPQFQHFCDFQGCDFVGGSASAVSEHAKIHLPKPVSGSSLYCNICKKGFTQVARKNEHDANIHPPPGKEWVKTCEYCFDEDDGCKTIFKFKANKKAHMAKCVWQPGGAPRSGCFFCAQHFATVGYRNKHCINKHAGQKFNKKDKNIVKYLRPEDPVEPEDEDDV